MNGCGVSRRWLTAVICKRHSQGSTDIVRPADANMGQACCRMSGAGARGHTHAKFAAGNRRRRPLCENVNRACRREAIYSTSRSARPQSSIWTSRERGSGACQTTRTRTRPFSLGHFDCFQDRGSWRRMASRFTSEAARSSISSANTSCPSRARFPTAWCASLPPSPGVRWNEAEKRCA